MRLQIIADWLAERVAGWPGVRPAAAELLQELAVVGLPSDLLEIYRVAGSAPAGLLPRHPEGPLLPLLPAGDVRRVTASYRQDGIAVGWVFAEDREHALIWSRTHGVFALGSQGDLTPVSWSEALAGHLDSLRAGRVFR